MNEHRSEPDGDPVAASYAEAVAELEAILDELDGDQVDVDVLAARVERAAELIEFCRERIHRARVQVERVVASLADDEPDDEPAVAADDEPF